MLAYETHTFIRLNSEPVKLLDLTKDNFTNSTISDQMKNREKVQISELMNQNANTIRGLK